MPAPVVPAFSGPLPIKTDLANYEANSQRFMNEFPGVIAGMNAVGSYMNENMPTVTQLNTAVASATDSASTATTKAVEATGQAGIAATKAGEASGSAAAADTARIAAQDAKTLAEAAAALAVASSFASGTAMLFIQTAAPTGWTKSTAHNNKALRVVSGAAGSGGSVAFTTAFASKSVVGTVGSTTLSTAQMPSHQHAPPAGQGYPYVSSAAITGKVNPAEGSGNWDFGGSHASVGGSGSHNHTFTGTNIDLAVQYVDAIICTKD